MERIEQKETHEIAVFEAKDVYNDNVIRVRVFLKQRSGSKPDVIELEKQSIPALIEALKKYME